MGSLPNSPGIPRAGRVASSKFRGFAGDITGNSLPRSCLPAWFYTPDLTLCTEMCQLKQKEPPAPVRTRLLSGTSSEYQAKETANQKDIWPSEWLRMTTFSHTHAHISYFQSWARRTSTHYSKYPLVEDIMSTLYFTKQICAMGHQVFKKRLLNRNACLESRGHENHGHGAPRSFYMGSFLGS